MDMYYQNEIVSFLALPQILNLHIPQAPENGDLGIFVLPKIDIFQTKF